MTALSPSPRKALLIVNPTAGHYSSQRMAGFVQHLERAGLTVQVTKTRYRGHAADIVRNRPSETDLIIAGGGDGTIAEIAQAMIPRPCLLALWPVGSANVLALELNIPFSDAHNAALIASRQPRPLWPGWLTTEGQPHPTLFLQMTGVGPDGWVVKQLSSALKKRIGRLAYILTALRLPFAYPFPAFETCVDGKTYRSCLTIISKGRLYGGPFRLFPHNHHEEPVFSILMLHQWNPVVMLKQLLAFVCHRPYPDPAFSYIKGQTITCSDNRPVPVQSDGDFRGITPCRIASASTPVQIICPPRNQPPSEERSFFQRYSLNIGKRRC